MTRLETPSLILRPFESTDFDDVHDYAQDPEVTLFQEWGPNDEAATREFIERAIVASRKDVPGDIEFGIVERTSGRVVGGCGVHARREPFREFEVGWTLGRSHWRKGFGTEAASALVDFSFSTLGAHRLYALIDSENRGSIALAEKMGFLREGHQRSDVLIRGEWRDTLVYARLEP